MRTSLFLTVVALAVAALLLSGTPVQAQYYARMPGPGYGPAPAPAIPAYGRPAAYYGAPRSYAAYYGGSAYMPRTGTWNGWNGGYNGYWNGGYNGYWNGYGNGWNRYPTWTRSGYGPVMYGGRVYR